MDTKSVLAQNANISKYLHTHTQLCDTRNGKRFSNLTKRFNQCKKVGRYRVRSTDAPVHSTGEWLAANVITKTIMFKKWIPMKRNVKFISDTTTVTSNLPELGALYLACADTLSTASSDNVVAAFKCTVGHFCQRDAVAALNPGCNVLDMGEMHVATET